MNSFQIVTKHTLGLRRGAESQMTSNGRDSGKWRPFSIFKKIHIFCTFPQGYMLFNAPKLGRDTARGK